MEEKKTKKLSYDQLNAVCNQLSKQNEALIGRIKELEEFHMFKRLDYLFKVVEFASTFNDADFVGSCIDEIKGAMIIPEAEAESQEK